MKKEDFRRRLIDALEQQNILSEKILNLQKSTLKAFEVKTSASVQSLSASNFLGDKPDNSEKELFLKIKEKAIALYRDSSEVFIHGAVSMEAKKFWEYQFNKNMPKATQ